MIVHVWGVPLWWLQEQEQHNTRCALLGGEGGSDCILHDICTLYGHQSMHSMLGRDHHYYYTPHSAAIRCDGVTADGNVCIDTWYKERGKSWYNVCIQSRYTILGIFTAAASCQIRVCLSCSCQNPMVRCSQVPKLGSSVVYKINTQTLFVCSVI